ncbi:MAG TPA: hypothetical protein PKC73_08755, partial [Dermatophilaceae bacterium]|nr:hypothetical protein [Dermatophilaceae bacterium]
MSPEDALVRRSHCVGVGAVDEVHPGAATSVTPAPSSASAARAVAAATSNWAAASPVSSALGSAAAVHPDT